MGADFLSDYDLDEVDEKILMMLQEDARNLTSGEIAEQVGISSSTVRKRIYRLREEGMIKGFHAEVDYEQCGYPLRMLLFCTASISERGQLIDQVLEIDGVVSVTELVSGNENLLVTAVGKEDRDITTVAEKLLGLNLTISDEVLLRSQNKTPFKGFGS